MSQHNRGTAHLIDLTRQSECLMSELDMRIADALVKPEYSHNLRSFGCRVVLIARGQRDGHLVTDLLGFAYGDAVEPPPCLYPRPASRCPLDLAEQGARWLKRGRPNHPLQIGR